MKRKEVTAKTITQSNDAGTIQSKRGMARKAKRNSSKRLRRLLKKEQEST